MTTATFLRRPGHAAIAPFCPSPAPPARPNAMLNRTRWHRPQPVYAAQAALPGRQAITPMLPGRAAIAPFCPSPAPPARPNAMPNRTRWHRPQPVYAAQAALPGHHAITRDRATTAPHVRTQTPQGAPKCA